MRSVHPEANQRQPIPKTHGLWHSNPATPAQAQQLKLFDDRKKPPRKITQRDVILGLLRSARDRGEVVTLPQIMQLHIGQYSARFVELRERGFVIENEMERVGGAIHSTYRLIFDPELDGPEVQR